MRRDASGAWDDATADWYASTWGDSVSNRLAAELCGVVEGDVLLDIGCGTGTTLRTLAAELVDVELVGVDPTPRMLEIARRQTGDATRIRYLQTGGEDLPFEAGHFSLALLVNTLAHLVDARVALAEIRRVLRPQGRLVLVDGLVEGVVHDVGAICATLVAAGFGSPTATRHISGTETVVIIEAVRAEAV